ncbi:hypothetical protein UFOVP1476_42 [uncultured Caudovirales phage]|uniref:Uncharacterized protein n=1 Tax=uncultured Caudovirales phage TaxID=2100421 RepID=A0A6J5S491_9CAUD|nr:hypothetical protein UFOVP944_4 [uncultured Caudovirales phage]CAB4203268.1 hypothetical protein UFOVP1381_16 [uncultured Caudovirales phage]CAB4216107.1 hypothetical protein UFOVP1476_42 [uncultured Caudovirales phage]
MAVTVGRNAVIKIGANSGDDTGAIALTGLVSWTVDAPDTIDVTVAGNDHKKMIVGLQAGMITAEVIADGDATLATAITNGLSGTTMNCYFYADGGTTPVYAWESFVTGSFQTGGPNAESRRTITFYRQAEAPLD